MDSDRLQTWLTLGANIAVLVGIVFLAVEIRQNSEHLALQLEFQAARKSSKTTETCKNQTKLLYSARH